MKKNSEVEQIIEHHDKMGFLIRNKTHREVISEAIEQYIADKTKRYKEIAHDSQMSEISMAKKFDDYRIKRNEGLKSALWLQEEANKQYVIKVRIATAKSIRQQELDGGFCIDEYIAQLKKGLQK